MASAISMDKKMTEEWFYRECLLCLSAYSNQKGNTMQQETFTLYKLIVLYMLDQISVPLSKSTINSFILDKGYTNFLTLQQAIGELIEAIEEKLN